MCYRKRFSRTGPRRANTRIRSGEGSSDHKRGIRSAAVSGAAVWWRCAIVDAHVWRVRLAKNGKVRCPFCAAQDADKQGLKSALDPELRPSPDWSRHFFLGANQIGSSTIKAAMWRRLRSGYQVWTRMILVAWRIGRLVCSFYTCK